MGIRSGSACGGFKGPRIGLAMQHNAASSPEKISAQFSTRLARLKADRRVPAILVLKTSAPRSTRGSLESRRATINAVRSSAGTALQEIDEILARHGGSRLAQANALGTVSIETTPAGLRELATSDHVKAIIEDQPIALVR